MSTPSPAAAATPVVEVTDLHKHYGLARESLLKPRGRIFALNGVSFAIENGKSFGVVGESGCGKSTLARTVMGLEAPTAGSVRIIPSRAVGPQRARTLSDEFKTVAAIPE